MFAIISKNVSGKIFKGRSIFTKVSLLHHLLKVGWNALIQCCDLFQLNERTFAKSTFSQQFFCYCWNNEFDHASGLNDDFDDRLNDVSMNLDNGLDNRLDNGLDNGLDYGFGEGIDDVFDGDLTMMMVAMCLTCSVCKCRPAGVRSTKIQSRWPAMNICKRRRKIEQG